MATSTFQTHTLSRSASTERNRTHREDKSDSLLTSLGPVNQAQELVRLGDQLHQYEVIPNVRTQPRREVSFTDSMLFASAVGMHALFEHFELEEDLSLSLSLCDSNHNEGLVIQQEGEHLFFAIY